LPSVAVVSSAFAKQSHYQAEMLNLSEVRVSFVRHPISDASASAMEAKAKGCWQDVCQSIKTDLPLPSWAMEEVQGCST